MQSFYKDQQPSFNQFIENILPETSGTHQIFKLPHKNPSSIDEGIVGASKTKLKSIIPTMFSRSLGLKQHEWSNYD